MPFTVFVSIHMFFESLSVLLAQIYTTLLFLPLFFIRLSLNFFFCLLDFLIVFPVSWHFSPSHSLTFLQYYYLTLKFEGLQLNNSGYYTDFHSPSTCYKALYNYKMVKNFRKISPSTLSSQSVIVLVC